MSDTLKQALFEHLSANVALAALVGARIYSGNAPSGAQQPYLTMVIDDYDSVRHSGGASGLARAAVTINCWSESSSLITSTADAVRESLDNYRGSMGTVALNVRGAFLRSRQDEKPIRNDASETIIYQHSMGFDIWHSEA